MRPIEPPEPLPLELRIEVSALETLSALPSRKRPVDIDFFLAPGRIAKPGTRPSCIFVLLAVDPQSGTILGYEMLQALDGFQTMWEQVPGKAANVLTNAGFRPVELRVLSHRLQKLLKPLESVRGIKIHQHNTLLALDGAKQAMVQFFQNPR